MKYALLAFIIAAAANGYSLAHARKLWQRIVNTIWMLGIMLLALGVFEA